ncbi:hypothetical protein ANN_21605 [Periplaneta americana]|uniref:Uncharacterized protein n=1 Tax=Periplaneta americana TaxID=6978 RepID=A0ABQ8S6E4_PERAM|nr:hypothetical protein ANN_21605 [Periplaneta americana]
MSVKRRSGGPIRQLSLQQPAPSSMASRRPLRKQQSMDAGLWSVDAGLRVAASAIVSGSHLPQEVAATPKSNSGHGVFMRPRPVKLAWTDRRQQSLQQEAAGGEAAPGVEGARAEPAQPGHLPGPEQRGARHQELLDSPTDPSPEQDLPSPAPLLYSSTAVGVSKNMPLQRGVVTSSAKSKDLKDAAVIGDTGDQFASRSAQSNARQSPKQEHSSGASGKPKLSAEEGSAIIKESEQILIPGNKLNFNFSVFPKSSATVTSWSPSDAVSNSQDDAFQCLATQPEEKKICDVTKKETPSPSKEPVDLEKALDVPSTKTKIVVDVSPRKKEPVPADTAKPEKEVEVEEEAKDPRSVVRGSNKPSTTEVMTATMRRVNFRNSANNKAFSGSLTSEGNAPQGASAPASRVLSAPAHRSAPTPTKGILVQRGRRSVDVSSDSQDGEEEGVCPPRGVRSAPARRRLKSGARRRGRGRGEESSGEEAEGEAKPREKAPTHRSGRRGLARGAEIVTMVSLMSDGSDVDADGFLQPAAGPGGAPWLEERAQKETPAAQTPPTQRVVCLRKTPKSVSFKQPTPTRATPQKTSPATLDARRSNPVSTQAREGSVQAPIVSPAGQASKETVVQAPTQQDTQNSAGTENMEEEQAPSAEASTTPAAEPAEQPAAPTAPSPRPLSSEPPSTGLGVMVARILKPEHKPLPTPTCAPAEPPDGAEPEFQSPKERECWQLYRRMLEKGVSVSYDTVLRGMLTPTEYRLRRNALLSTC